MRKIIIIVIGAAIMLGAGAYAQMGDMDTCPMCKGKGMMEKGMMPPPPQMQGNMMQQGGCPMMNPEGMGPGMQGQKMDQMQKKMMQGRMEQKIRQDRMCMTKCMMYRCGGGLHNIECDSTTRDELTNLTWAGEYCVEDCNNPNLSFDVSYTHPRIVMISAILIICFTLLAVVMDWRVK